jgi:hypothetical protein
MELADIRQAIMEDLTNQAFTKKGIKPLFQASSTKNSHYWTGTGIKNTRKGRLFDDASGENLRKWLGVDREFFYASGHFAILPMDFYYPGKGKSGVCRLARILRPNGTHSL